MVEIDRTFKQVEEFVRSTDMERFTVRDVAESIGASKKATRKALKDLRYFGDIEQEFPSDRRTSGQEIVFRKARKQGFVCIRCRKEINRTDFPDEESKKEYGKTQLCKRCQEEQ